MTIKDNCLIFLFVKYRVHTDTVFLFSFCFALKTGLRCISSSRKIIENYPKCAKNIFTMTV